MLEGQRLLNEEQKALSPNTCGEHPVPARRTDLHAEYTMLPRDRLCPGRSFGLQDISACGLKVVRRDDVEQADRTENHLATNPATGCKIRCLRASPRCITSALVQPSRESHTRMGRLLEAPSPDVQRAIHPGHPERTLCLEY